jgi:hypothetical protein
MANLNVIITEEITLPNRNIEKTSNTKVISGINQIVRRIDTIVSTFSGSGIEIIKFSDSEEQQTAGSFVKSDVKYIRITHISGNSDALIYLIADGPESVIFNLSPGKTIMLNDADINAASSEDYIVDGYVDQTYYSSFAALNTIKAKAVSSSIQLEYFVASI